MHKIKQLILAGVLLCLWQAPASIANTRPLALVGESEFKLLMLPVYHSRLYTSNGEYMPGQRPVKLEIRYLLNIKAEKLLERTDREWQQLGIAAQDRKTWLEQLSQLWPDVRKNDELAVIVNTDNTSTFYWNRQPIGHISDDRLGSSFLDIWLSPNTSAPAHRHALLGKN